MERYYTAAQIGEILGGKSSRDVRQMIVRGDFGTRSRTENST